MRSRARLIIAIAAVLLLTTIVVLPRVIDAQRSKKPSVDKNPSLSAITYSSLGQNNNVTVGESVHNDTSPPLRDMKQEKVNKRAEKEANENPKIPASRKHKDSEDPVVQGSDLLSAFAPNMPAASLNIDGIPYPGVGCNCAPPDPNGEVGATQYVQ